MPKRFVHSEIWDSDEFHDSNEKEKLLFFYLVSHCSDIGIFSQSLRIISFKVGFEVTEEMLTKSPLKIEKLPDGRFWLSKFCKNQYGILKANPKNRPHTSFIKKLKEESLDHRVSIDYQYSIDSLKDKDKEKEKEKNKEKEELENSEKKEGSKDGKSDAPTENSELKLEEPLEKALKMWNSCSWTKNRKFISGDVRRKHSQKIKARIKEFGPDVLERWEEKVNSLSNLAGQSWFTFEWSFHSNENLEKVLSGKYDNAFQSNGRKRVQGLKKGASLADRVLNGELDFTPKGAKEVEAEVVE